MINKMFKVYKGTKQAFVENGKAAANAESIVFITGGADSSKSCIFAQGTYFANFAEFISAINYVKGISVDGQSYNAVAGGGYVAFGSKDPATVAVNANNSGIEIGLSEAFVSKVNSTAANLGSSADAANKDGSAFARIANLAALVSDLTGGSTDSIEGQITTAINALRTEIVGTLDTSDSKTLQAINDELDSLVTSIQTINETSLVALGQRIDNEVPVTISEAAGSGDVLKTYTFTQNGKEIGKINIAKDLVVTGGEIVEIDGVKNLQLTIANQSTPVNIPVTDLVDVYTAQKNASQVQVAISNTNEISATIKSGSITSTELANNSVNSDKIIDQSITKSKLNTELQGSVDKANSAIQEIKIWDASVGVSNTNGVVNLQIVRDIKVSGTSIVSGDATVDLANKFYTKDDIDAMFSWEEIV